MLALSLLAVRPAAAQSTATLQGTVTDSQNAIMPGVSVTITNTATALSITGSGLLDIANHDLLVNSTATPFATIHNNSNGVGNAGTGHWDRGYNFQPGNGFGVWDGASGITSATARASHQDVALNNTSVS